MEIKARIDEIRFRNDDNGWTVAGFSNENGDKETAVGVMPFISDGDELILTGAWVSHPRFGKQFRVDNFKKMEMTSTAAILAYLSSGFIKGVGKATAELLVEEFGEDTLKIIKDEPEKLTCIPGIGKIKAERIHESYQEKTGMQDMIMGMQSLGFTISMAMRIYKKYGPDCVSIVKQNPYRLIDDIESIGFKTADKIANEAGYEYDSEFRVKAGLKYTLSLAKQEGNTCLPKEMLINFTAERVLNIDTARVEEILEKNIMTSELIEKNYGGKLMIFESYMHYLELDSAAKLIEIAGGVETLPLFDIDGEIEKLEKKFGLTLADSQREAVKGAVSDGVIVITGGPGTGKTTILKFIIEIMERLDLVIELAAPTGRAAKRITDTTGREARTVHRLLEYSMSDNEFSRNEDYPIEADAVIIDEMSMMDVYMFHALLDALETGTRLIMVGDVDQLPSVGAGNVLKDIVNSGAVRIIRLNEIFRQAGRSMIVTNAHLINNGRQPVLSRENPDFMFYECDTHNIALSSVINLCYDYNYDGRGNDIQVLAPMKNGILGVYNLNTQLQNALNPHSDEKDELLFGSTLFREGDRVMQIKNNYDIHWEKSSFDSAGDSEGEGVFNGDIGTVMGIDKTNKFLTVLFDDEREVCYNFTQLEELELAYCISIHKSQGSEFPCVVLPLMDGPMMLMNRNILYTAVTRARSCVYIIGSRRCVANMVNNTRIKSRFSALMYMLKERMGAAEE